MEPNEIFSIEERDEFGKIADQLAAYVATFYEKNTNEISEEELGMLVLAKGYLKLYKRIFSYH